MDRPQCAARRRASLSSPVARDACHAIHQAPRRRSQAMAADARSHAVIAARSAASARRPTFASPALSRATRSAASRGAASTRGDHASFRRRCACRHDSCRGQAPSTSAGKKTDADSSMMTDGPGPASDVSSWSQARACSAHPGATRRTTTAGPGSAENGAGITPDQLHPRKTHELIPQRDPARMGTPASRAWRASDSSPRAQERPHRASQLESCAATRPPSSTRNGTVALPCARNRPSAPTRITRARGSLVSRFVSRFVSPRAAWRMASSSNETDAQYQTSV